MTKTEKEILTTDEETHVKTIDKIVINCSECGVTLTIRKRPEEFAHEVYYCPICHVSLGEGFEVVTDDE